MTPTGSSGRRSSSARFAVFVPERVIDQPALAEPDVIQLDRVLQRAALLAAHYAFEHHVVGLAD